MSDAAAVPAPADNTQPAPTSILSGLASQQDAPPAAQQPPPQQQEQPKPVTTGTWRDKLPEDLRGNPSLSKFETEEGLAKSYVNLERMLGGDRVPVPKDPDDKEAWSRYYAAGGRPEKPEDYKIERPTEIPAGIEYREEDEGFLRQFAHENGWNQRQLDAAYKVFYEREAQKVQAWHKMQADQREEGERALQRLGNVAEVKNLARTTITQYFDEQAIAKIEQAGLGSDPVFIQTLAKIGKDLTGHQVLKGAGGEAVKTTQQLQVDAAEYRSKHQTALYDKTHPEHDMRVKELNSLYQRLYPEQRAS